MNLNVVGTYIVHYYIIIDNDKIFWLPNYTIIYVYSVKCQVNRCVKIIQLYIDNIKLIFR